MSEPDLIERIVDAITKKMTTPVPLSVQLWNAKIIGGYLQRSPAVVMERVVTLPGFPPPIRLPTRAENSKGQPLWKATEVIAWAESHRQRPVGRPRRAD